MPRRKQQAPKRAAGKRPGFASGCPAGLPCAPSPPRVPPRRHPQAFGESLRMPRSSLLITPSSLACSDLPNPLLSSLRLGGGSRPTKPNLLKLFPPLPSPPPLTFSQPGSFIAGQSPGGGFGVRSRETALPAPHPYAWSVPVASGLEGQRFLSLGFGALKCELCPSLGCRLALDEQWEFSFDRQGGKNHSRKRRNL